jgi:hypothetical protein
LATSIKYCKCLISIASPVILIKITFILPVNGSVCKT